MNHDGYMQHAKGVKLQITPICISYQSRWTQSSIFRTVLSSMRVMEATEQTSLIALDVLYPEVCKLCDFTKMSHQATIICMKLLICLISLKRARDEMGRSNKVLHGKCYALVIICVCVHG